MNCVEARVHTPECACISINQTMVSDFFYFLIDKRALHSYEATVAHYEKIFKWMQTESRKVPH